MSPRTVTLLKVVVWIVCLLPLAQWIMESRTPGGLGTNPVEHIQEETGFTALYLLLATLAITPLRRLTGFNGFIRFRRLLGNFAFFYACLHMLAFSLWDHSFDMGAIVSDTLKRPFIFAGMVAFLLLVPLAVTSTSGWIRRLGGARWNRLHSLIYISGIAAIVHFWFKQKKDHTEPLIFGAILAALLLFRVLYRFRKRGKEASAAEIPSAAEAD